MHVYHFHEEATHTPREHPVTYREITESTGTNCKDMLQQALNDN
jgi:hypothetical protein